MSGSQFGGSNGPSMGGRGSGDGQYGYFSNGTAAKPGYSVTPGATRLGGPVMDAPAGPAGFGLGTAPAALSALPARGLLDHRALRGVIALLVVAALAFAGFKWYHRNDPVLPASLGTLPLTASADFQPALEAAQKQASLSGDNVQVAAAGYGIPPQQAVLMVFRKDGIAAQFADIPASVLHSYGAESCFSSKVTTECFRAAGDLLVMVLAPAKIAAADVAGWTEEAFRAQ